MKPAPFAYFAPDTLEAALQLMAEYGYDAKLLAGGQSLIPAMNFRLARPSVLVDLNRVPALAGISLPTNGGLRIGAMTRQRALEKSEDVARCAPLLHEVMPWIAHVQIRNRGTLGGSLAHADPAAELPAVAVAMRATFTIRCTRGERKVDAADFYVGLFTTDLAPDEVLVAIDLPPLPERTGWGFAEFARRRGDFALAGCAATITCDHAGRCTDARLVYLSVGEYPVAAESARMLVGSQPTRESIVAAAESAAANDVEPLADIHSTVAYRRHLAGVLAARALSQAATRALEPLRQPA